MLRRFFAEFRTFDWLYLTGYVSVFVGICFPLYHRGEYSADPWVTLLELLLGLLLLTPLSYRVVTLFSLAAIVSILNQWPCLLWGNSYAACLNLAFRLLGILAFFGLPVYTLVLGGWLVVSGLTWLTALRFYEELAGSGA